MDLDYTLTAGLGVQRDVYGSASDCQGTGRIAVTSCRNPVGNQPTATRVSASLAAVKQISYPRNVGIFQISAGVCHQLAGWY